MPPLAAAAAAIGAFAVELGASAIVGSVIGGALVAVGVNAVINVVSGKGIFENAIQSAILGGAVAGIGAAFAEPVAAEATTAGLSESTTQAIGATDKAAFSIGGTEGVSNTGEVFSTTADAAGRVGPTITSSSAGSSAIADSGTSLFTQAATDTASDTTKSAISAADEGGSVTKQVIKKAADESFWGQTKEFLTKDPGATMKIGGSVLANMFADDKNQYVEAYKYDTDNFNTKAATGSGGFSKAPLLKPQYRPVTTPAAFRRPTPSLLPTA